MLLLRTASLPCKQELANAQVGARRGGSGSGGRYASGSNQASRLCWEGYGCLRRLIRSYVSKLQAHQRHGGQWRDPAGGHTRGKGEGGAHYKEQRACHRAPHGGKGDPGLAHRVGTDPQSSAELPTYKLGTQSLTVFLQTRSYVSKLGGPRASTAFCCAVHATTYPAHHTPPRVHEHTQRLDLNVSHVSCRDQTQCV